MSYFSYFPNFIYELDGKSFTVKDILRRSTFISEYKPYTDLYEEYTINDAESLQSIAETYYGSVYYYWVISLFNEIHDINFEFPMPTNTLEARIEELYGADKYKTKYFRDSSTGLIAGEVKEYFLNYIEPEKPGEPGNERYTPVTFYDYETSLNEEKRYIKLLRKELLSDFIIQLRRSLING